MGIRAGQPAVRVELGIWSLSIGPAGIFQRLLSPSLFNISMLLGVPAAKPSLCCHHWTTVRCKLRWNIISVRWVLCMRTTSSLHEGRTIFSAWINNKFEYFKFAKLEIMWKHFSLTQRQTSGNGNQSGSKYSVQFVTFYTAVCCNCRLWMCQTVSVRCLKCWWV